MTGLLTTFSENVVLFVAHGAVFQACNAKQGHRHSHRGSERRTNALKQCLSCGGCRPEATAAGANGHAGLMLPPPPRPPKRADPDPDPGLPSAPAGASSDGEAHRPSGDAGLGLQAGDARAVGDAAAHSGGEAGEGLTNPVNGDDAHAAVTAVHAKAAALFREWLAGHKAAQAAAEKARPAPCHSGTEV